MSLNSLGNHADKDIELYILGFISLIQSKSVGELSQINSLSDFPIPTPIEKLIAKTRPDPGAAAATDGSSKW